MLKHPIPHFPLNSEGIACSVAELNAALCIDLFRSLQLLDSQGAMALSLCQYVARRAAGAEAALACRMLALLAPPRDARLAATLTAMLRDLALVSVASCLL